MNGPANYVDSSGKFAIALSCAALTGLFMVFAVVIVAVAVFSIASDPAFQRALTEAINTLGTKVISASDAIKEAIDSALSRAKWKAIDQRLERHHIVARAAKMSMRQDPDFSLRWLVLMSTIR